MTDRAINVYKLSQLCCLAVVWIRHELGEGFLSSIYLISNEGHLGSLHTHHQNTASTEKVYTHPNVWLFMRS